MAHAKYKLQSRSYIVNFFMRDAPNRPPPPANFHFHAVLANFGQIKSGAPSFGLVPPSGSAAK